MLGQPLVPVELVRHKRAEQVDWGVDLGLEVGPSKTAQSWWVAVRVAAAHPPPTSPLVNRRRRVVSASRKIFVPVTFQ